MTSGYFVGGTTGCSDTRALVANGQAATLQLPSSGPITIRAAYASGFPGPAVKVAPEVTLITGTGTGVSLCGGADLTSDGVVDVQDLLLLLAAFGTTADGDCDGSGNTDVSDLLILLSNFGAAACTAAAAPLIVTITTDYCAPMSIVVENGVSQHNL